MPPPEERNCRVQIRGHHPVGRSLTPLQQEGNCRVRFGEVGGASGCTPPRQAELDTPPQEGNCLVQIRGHYPVRLRLPPLHRRGIALCRYEDNTPSGFARHPSTGGELLCADTRTPLPSGGELLDTPSTGGELAWCRYEDTTPSSGA